MRPWPARAGRHASRRVRQACSKLWAVSNFHCLSITKRRRSRWRPQQTAPVNTAAVQDQSYEDTSGQMMFLAISFSMMCSSTLAALHRPAPCRRSSNTSRPGPAARRPPTQGVTMNAPLNASKYLVGLIAVGALLGGGKKHDVTTTTPTADTTVTTPATTAATTTTTTTTPATDTTGSSGMNGSTGAGTSTPSTTAVTPPATTAGMTGNGMPDKSKNGVRNNSGQTQGATPNSNVPTADGSR